MILFLSEYWLYPTLVILQVLSGFTEMKNMKESSRTLIKLLAVAISAVVLIGIAGPMIWKNIGFGVQDEYFRKLNNYGLCQFALERRDADRPLPGDHCPEGGEYVYSPEHKRSLCSYPPHRAILLGETTPPEVFHRPW